MQTNTETREATGGRALASERSLPEKKQKSRARNFAPLDGISRRTAPIPWTSRSTLLCRKENPMALTAEERRRVCRQNAQRSTGPKTIAGKIKSSSNATTHGLSGQSLSLFGGDTVALRDKLEYWVEFYKPSGPQERALIERAVLASTQECRCIATAHHHVLESGDPAEAVGAILGCEDPAQAGANPRGDVQGAPVLALYRRYEQRHRQEFHRTYCALLKSCAADVATAPVAGLPEAADCSGDGERGSGQLGYY